MPRFDTPAPIALELELIAAEVRIEASDRDDTLVEVRPGDPAKRDDVAAAERTQIEHGPGRVLIRTPKTWRVYNPFGYGGGAVDVRVEVPSGSSVVLRTGMGSVRSSGELGDSQVKTGMGDIHLDRAASARLDTGMGDLEIGHVTDGADLKTASGEIRAGVVHGAAVLKNANGDVRVAEAVQGSVEARTGYGEIQVGVPEGTAAWLDLSTGYGQVRNGLDRSGPPEPGEESVEVRAHSGYGDITINRAYRGAT